MILIGKYIGWFLKDKFVVKMLSVEDIIWWDNNVLMDLVGFDVFYEDMFVYMKGKEYFV